MQPVVRVRPIERVTQSAGVVYRFNSMQGIQGALWVGCLVLGQAADPPSVAPSNADTGVCLLRVRQKVFDDPEE